jgi:hypothetical protein
VQLPIPTGSTNQIQEINTGEKIPITIEVLDFYAVTELLLSIDVDNDTAGTQKAVILSGNTRTEIDYFALVATLIQINDTTDARTTPDVTFVFDNAYIRNIELDWKRANDPIMVYAFADSYTWTVA